ncbi:MAG: hypothetical protein H6867_06735 [Rhodospirillales bacterium]|nr:hypothetical protein [Rhodospirillales bacterium]MCB9995245.1 hypothetical protein [Rhodospirillales bacterium]
MSDQGPFSHVDSLQGPFQGNADVTPGQRMLDAVQDYAQKIFPDLDGARSNAASAAGQFLNSEAQAGRPLDESINALNAIGRFVSGNFDNSADRFDAAQRAMDGYTGLRDMGMPANQSLRTIVGDQYLNNDSAAPKADDVKPSDIGQFKV